MHSTKIKKKYICWVFCLLEIKLIQKIFFSEKNKKNYIKTCSAPSPARSNRPMSVLLFQPSGHSNCNGFSNPGAVLRFPDRTSRGSCTTSRVGWQNGHHAIECNCSLQENKTPRRRRAGVIRMLSQTTHNYY